MTLFLQRNGITIMSQLSRRNFLTGSAVVAGASLVGLQQAFAQALPLPREFENDVDVLNYALTLEHLEYAFYAQGLELFSNSSFAYLKDEGFKKVGRNLKEIRAHEQAHVETLTQVITTLGGTPVAACTYNFGFTDAAGFIATAQALENTGVMAYAGAAQYLSDPDLLTAAATIATVEARHAAYLNILVDSKALPFPAAFDMAKSEEEILAIAGPFIVSCP
jgi:rubrerythrin